MPGKIKVLFDANPLVKQKTGVGFYTEGVVKALAEIPELELIGHYFASRGPTPDLPKADNLSFTCNPWLIGQFVKALRKIHIRLPWELLAWQKADVLFFPNFTTWPSLFRTPKILTVHDLTYIDYPQFVSRRNLRFLRRYVAGDARRAASVLTISQFSKDRLVEEFKLPRQKVLVEPIPPPPPLAVKTHAGLPANFILFIGTIEPRKNIGGLVDAYAALPEALRGKYALVIAGGQGWNSDDVVERIKVFQAEGLNIVTPGYVDEQTRAALYAKAAVVVVPSFYEGFGMPLLEAMTYNAPLAVSNLPVLKEVTHDAAVYFDPSSTDSIKDALAKILTSSDLRHAQIKQFSGLLKNYSWQAVAADIYKDIQRLAD